MDDHYQEQRDRAEAEKPLWEEIGNIQRRNRKQAEEYYAANRKEIFPYSDEYWRAATEKTVEEVEAFKRKHNLK
jgi:hypothetical protein